MDLLHIVPIKTTVLSTTETKQISVKFVFVFRLLFGQLLYIYGHIT